MGIEFCSSAFSSQEADFLEKLGVSFLKLASMDLNYEDFLGYWRWSPKTGQYDKL
jgi:sialic acid synthase SpsE